VDSSEFVVLWGGESSLEIQMMCVDNYEIKSHVYEKFVEENKHLHTNGRLENGLVYLY
jgi:hypothetical protein